MLVALTIFWTLTMQGSLGLVAFGPYDSEGRCRAVAMQKLAKHDVFAWKKAFCNSSTGRSIEVTHK